MDTRKWEDFTLCVQKSVDIYYPNAEKVVLIMNHLNTYSIASLYAAFSPDEAKRTADRLDIHYAPKYGSWMNMAEISVLTHKCLSKYSSAKNQIILEAAAWCNGRNLFHTSVSGQFTAADERIKLNSFMLLLLRACLKNVKTPKQLFFFRHTFTIFLEIHPVFLRKIVFA